MLHTRPDWHLSKVLSKANNSVKKNTLKKWWLCSRLKAFLFPKSMSYWRFRSKKSKLSFSSIAMQMLLLTIDHHQSFFLILFSYPFIL